VIFIDSENEIINENLADIFDFDWPVGLYFLISLSV
jgi:hypothetical protein